VIPTECESEQVEVAEIAASHPVEDRAEREIAIIGALFHDIGKTRTFDHHLKRTDCGNLVCHDHLTLEICAPGLSFQRSIGALLD
jgi:3'-5' exoribonuclease